MRGAEAPSPGALEADKRGVCVWGGQRGGPHKELGLWDGNPVSFWGDRRADPGGAGHNVLGCRGSRGWPEHRQTPLGANPRIWEKRTKDAGRLRDRPGGHRAGSVGESPPGCPVPQPHQRPGTGAGSWERPPPPCWGERGGAARLSTAQHGSANPLRLPATPWRGAAPGGSRSPNPNPKQPPVRLRGNRHRIGPLGVGVGVLGRGHPGAGWWGWRCVGGVRVQEPAPATWGRGQGGREGGRMWGWG